MITPMFQARIDRTGNLSMQDPIEFRKHLLNLVRGKDGMDVGVVVKKPTKKRSDRQNRYYMGVICATLSDFCGHSKEEVHDAMRTMFLSYEDGGIVYSRSTTELTTAEAEEYYANIRNWALETLQVLIPEPNQADFL
jgi:hypothetical protein